MISSSISRSALRSQRPRDYTCAAIITSLPSAVLLLDAELRVVMANSAALLLFRSAKTSLNGTPISTVIPDPHIEVLIRNSVDRPTRMMETTLPKAGHVGAQQTLRITVVHLNRDNESRIARPRMPRDTHRLLVVEDISDKATLEQQLVESEQRAAMAQLAAGILHELANPLASLGSNLLFARRALTADRDVTQALDASLDQLDQMRQLLGTLSALPGRATLQCRTADVDDIVRICLTFIAQDAERRGVTVKTATATTPLTCEIDVRQIKQVLLNLLKNSMEAMPNGGQLEVRAGHHQAPSGQHFVKVEVTDTGIGIVESDLRKVFRPLFSTKRRGAGLGLSFCRQAVEEHGGEIRLKSEGKDKGTTATVLLPIRQPGTDE